MYFDFALNSPTIWVFFAVVLFLLVLAYFGIHKKIGGALAVSYTHLTLPTILLV